MANKRKAVHMTTEVIKEEIALQLKREEIKPVVNPKRVIERQC